MGESEVKGLIDQIDQYLKEKRSSLPIDAAHLLEEARDELENISFDSDVQKGSTSENIRRVTSLLLRFFTDETIQEFLDGLF